MARLELHPTAFHGYTPCRKRQTMPGPYLKQWRKHHGLTQKEVVDRLSMFDDPTFPTTEASLSRIETGKQPWAQPIVAALAHVYGIEIDDLMSRDPILEEKRAKALAEGDKVVSFDELRWLPDFEKTRLVSIYNAMQEKAS